MAVQLSFNMEAAVQTDCIWEENANEFEWVHNEKQNPQHQAKMLLQKVKCFWRINSGEMAEIRPPQFGTRKPLRFKDKLPTYSYQIHESMGTQLEKLWLVFFIPKFPLMSMHLWKKNKGGRKRATWKRTTSITLLGLPWVNVFRHTPRENSTRSHALLLLLRSQGPWRSQIWIPDTRHVLEAVFNLPCLIDGSLWLQIFHLLL